jgi:hypothetical protein
MRGRSSDAAAGRAFCIVLFITGRGCDLIAQAIERRPTPFRTLWSPRRGATGRSQESGPSPRRREQSDPPPAQLGAPGRARPREVRRASRSTGRFPTVASSSLGHRSRRARSSATDAFAQERSRRYVPRKVSNLSHESSFARAWPSGVPPGMFGRFDSGCRRTCRTSLVGTNGRVIAWPAPS